MKISTVAVLLACLFASGCAALEQFGLGRPTARITGVQFADANVNSAKLVFDVEVNNPYAVPLPLTHLNYSLSSGQASLLKGDAQPAATIPAKSTQSLSLPVTVNYLEVFKSLKGIRPGATIPYTAGLDLSVDTPGLGPLTLPLKKEGQLTLPTVSGTDVINLLNSLQK
jgi:LEA14-like dessication related protein